MTEIAPLSVTYDASSDAVVIDAISLPAQLFRVAREAVVKLSPRERQVLSLFTEGISQKEIGAQLNLNPKTINTYKENAKRKLKVSSNAELLRILLFSGGIN